MSPYCPEQNHMWARPAHYVDNCPIEASFSTQPGPTHHESLNSWSNSWSTQNESPLCMPDDFSSFTQNQVQTPQFFHRAHDSSISQGQMQSFQGLSTPYLDPCSYTFNSDWKNQHNVSWGSNQDQAHIPPEQNCQNWAQYPNNSYDQAQYGEQPTYSPLYPTDYPLNGYPSKSGSQPPFLDKFDELNQLILESFQAKQQTLSEMQTQLTQLTQLIKETAIDQLSSYPTPIPEDELLGNDHTESFYNQSMILQKHSTQITHDSDIEGTFEESSKEDLEKDSSWHCVSEDHQPNPICEKGPNQYVDHQLGGEKEEVDTSDQISSISLPAFDESLFQVKDIGDVMVEQELNDLLTNYFQIKEELHTTHEFHLDQDSLDLAEGVNLLPSLDVGEPELILDTLQLVNWPDSPEPNEHTLVEEHISFIPCISHLLNNNHLVEAPQVPHPPSYSHLQHMHENFKFEVVGERLGNNRVYINMFNTYNDPMFEEEYFIIDDMIIPPLFPNQGAPFGLLDPPWRTSDPFTHMNQPFLQWYKDWNLKEERISWWLILNGTRWL